MYEQEKWPSWWKDVVKVEILKEGNKDDVGKKCVLHGKVFYPIS